MTAGRLLRILTIGDYRETEVDHLSWFATWVNPFVYLRGMWLRATIKPLYVGAILTGLLLLVNHNYAERIVWGLIIMFFAFRQAYFNLAGCIGGKRGFYTVAAAETTLLAAGALHSHIVKERAAQAQQAKAAAIAAAANAPTTPDPSMWVH